MAEGFEPTTLWSPPTTRSTLKHHFLFLTKRSSVVVKTMTRVPTTTTTTCQRYYTLSHLIASFQSELKPFKSSHLFNKFLFRKDEGRTEGCTACSIIKLTSFCGCFEWEWQCFAVLQSHERTPLAKIWTDFCWAQVNLVMGGDSCSTGQSTWPPDFKRCSICNYLFFGCWMCPTANNAFGR